MRISDWSSDVCSSDLLTEQLKATGGFRYTWDKQENDSTRITNLFPVDPSQGTAPISICTDAAPTPDGCQLGLAKKSKAPTWLIDLDYNPVRPEERRVGKECVRTCGFGGGA